jgi:hypothetical protein
MPGNCYATSWRRCGTFMRPSFVAESNNAGMKLWEARAHATPHDILEWTPFQWAFNDCVTNVEDYLSTLLPPEHIQWVHDEPGKHDPAVRDALHRITRFWTWDDPDARLASSVRSAMGRLVNPACSNWPTCAQPSSLTTYAAARSPNCATSCA